MAAQYFDLFQNTRSQKENNYIGRLEIKSQLTDWLNLLVSGNFNNYDFINESKILGSNPGFAGWYSLIKMTICHCLQIIQLSFYDQTQLGKDLGNYWVVGSK